MFEGVQHTPKGIRWRDKLASTRLGISVGFRTLVFELLVPK